VVRSGSCMAAHPALARIPCGTMAIKTATARD